ncbi:helix-turn-helix domain-containing protein [Agromyces sp. PvR057]|uniref:helix-turn-helix domain-containing protein n=1 Tax=Agromyces sp. PvR057 TaxID=3156403 RepID=UPI000E2684FF
MPDPSADERPLPGRQREARSNDAAVLAAAREVLSAQGHDASMAEIARHAGVGVASIYRRYPTKEALVEALRVTGVSAAAALAHEVAGSMPDGAGAAPDGHADDGADTGAAPAGAVASFLARQITGAPGPILQPPGRGAPISSELGAASEELHAGLRRLVARDRADGLVPEGFTAADVMQLLLHLRPALPYPRAHADALHLRYLDLAMRGLAEQARDGVVLDDGPHWDEWMGSWHD